MTTWPSGSVPTGNLDAGTDSPAAARSDLKTMADKVNDMIGARGAASGVASLDASTKIPLAQLPLTTVANGMLAWQAAGSYSWTVPAGITRVYAECFGAGGGGGYGDQRTVPATPHGGGGGAGGAAIKIFSVTPGDTFTIVVGAGGAGGNGPANADGGDGAASTITHDPTSTTMTGQGGLKGLGGGGSGLGGSGASATGSFDVKIGGGAAQSGIPGMGGIGGSSKTGSAPLATGCGFGSGGYGSGTNGPASGFAGADGGVLLVW